VGDGGNFRKQGQAEASGNEKATGED